MRFKLIILSLCLCVSNEVQSLNILGIFPYPGKSHFLVFKTYLEELVARGHNVTVISHFPREEPLRNYHDIDLSEKTEILEGVLPFERSYWVILKISLFLTSTGSESCKTLLGNKDVQNLWTSNTKFDVAVVEQFNSDCLLGLTYKLGVPAVGINTHTLMVWHYERFGIPYKPSYVPFQFLEGGTKPTFYQRIERTIFYAYMNAAYKLLCQRVDQDTLAQYFDEIPPLEELAKEIKFLLIYNSFTLTGSNLLPPNVVEVGGYHVAKPKQLPKEILKFIEESEHGVIYVSFGSMLKASTTPKYIVDIITSALAELPQRILWKWDETLPNTKNILTSRWFPQNDILAHPKVVAFFSHCGMLSTTEAVHHGVPMLGMPIFGDQPINAALMEESGLGVQIQIAELNKELLLKQFKTILNPEFKNKVKLLSKAWHDRPISAMDTAIYWTEYAARHANFSFKSPAVAVPYYQYAGLDVLLFFLVIGFAHLFISYKILKYFCLRKAPKSQMKMKTK